MSDDAAAPVASVQSTLDNAQSDAVTAAPAPVGSGQRDGDADLTPAARAPETLTVPPRASLQEPQRRDATVSSASASDGPASSTAAVFEDRVGLGVAAGSSTVATAPISEGKAAQKPSRGQREQAPACLVACNEKLVAFNARAKERRENGKVFGTRYEVHAEDSTVGQQQEGKETLLQRSIVPALVFIILAWVYLVFTWRLCVPMLRQDADALNTRGAGVVLIVLLNLLWLTTLWAYLRVLVSSPGFARDYISESDKLDGPPLPPQQSAPAAGLPPQTHAYSPAVEPQPLDESIPIEQSALSPTAHDDAGSSTTASAAPPAIVGSSVTAADEPHINPGLPAIVGPHVAAAVGGAKDALDLKAAVDSAPSVQPPPQPAYQTHPPPYLPEPFRLPPPIPPLHPSQRWCARCKHIKPLRTHHCRKCGTCVLRMDHHCAWIGGCVGAQNHKFFNNFLFWVTSLEIFLLIAVAFHFAKGIRRGDAWTLDGYLVSMFVILAFFTLFTSTLLGVHTWLILHNITTLEQLNYQRRSQQEKVILDLYFRKGRGQGYDKLREKDSVDERGRKRVGTMWMRKTREASVIKAKWDRVWGMPTTENHLWWLGGPGERSLAEDKHAGKTEQQTVTAAGVKGEGAALVNWTEVMGTNIFAWFLPIGSSPRDGTWYPMNPRFGEHGAWRTRETWPQPLQ